MYPGQLGSANSSSVTAAQLTALTMLRPPPAFFLAITANPIKLLSAPLQHRLITTLAAPHVVRSKGAQRSFFETCVQQGARDNLHGCQNPTPYKNGIIRPTQWFGQTEHQILNSKRHRCDIKRFFRPDNFATPRVVFFNMQPTKQPPSTAQPSSPRQIRQRNAPNRLGNTVDSGQLRFQTCIKENV